MLLLLDFQKKKKIRKIRNKLYLNNSSICFKLRKELNKLFNMSIFTILLLLIIKQYLNKITIIAHLILKKSYFIKIDNYSKECSN